MSLTKTDHSRFPEWDEGVLAIHSLALKVLASRRARNRIVDGNTDEREIFVGAVLEEMTKTGRDWFSSADLAKLYCEATNRRNLSTKYLITTIRRWSAEGSFPRGIQQRRRPGGAARRWRICAAGLHEWLDER